MFLCLFVLSFSPFLKNNKHISNKPIPNRDSLIVDIHRRTYPRATFKLQKSRPPVVPSNPSGRITCPLKWISPTRFVSGKHQPFLPSASAPGAAVPPRRAPTPPSAVVGVRGSAVPSHLDPQLASVQERAVHGVHGVLGVPFIVEAHEGEAAAVLRVAVSRDVHVPDSAVLFEHAPEGLRCRPVRQVVHFQGRHAVDVGRRPSVTHVEDTNRSVLDAARLCLTPTKKEMDEICDEAAATNVDSSR